MYYVDDNGGVQEMTDVFCTRTFDNYEDAITYSKQWKTAMKKVAPVRQIITNLYESVTGNTCNPIQPLPILIEDICSELDEIEDPTDIRKKLTRADLDRYTIIVKNLGADFLYHHLVRRAIVRMNEDALDTKLMQMEASLDNMDKTTEEYRDACVANAVSTDIYNNVKPMYDKASDIWLSMGGADFIGSDVKIYADLAEELVTPTNTGNPIWEAMRDHDYSYVAKILNDGSDKTTVSIMTGNHQFTMDDLEDVQISNTLYNALKAGNYTIDTSDNGLIINDDENDGFIYY